jgi:lipoate---protein ligase
LESLELQIGVYDFDDALIEAARLEQALKIDVYRILEPIIVLGRSSKPDIELHVDRCRQDRLPVIRRHGGGCAVVLDPGTLVLSVAHPSKGIGDIRATYTKWVSVLINSLDRLHVKNVRRDGHSDLVISDRKISGSCMQIRKGLTYFTASILIDPDIELMELYLKHPPREPQYRKGRRHRDFVGSLSGLAGVGDVEEFLEELKATLAPMIGDERPVGM